MCFEMFVFGFLLLVFFGFVGFKVDFGVLGGGCMFVVVLGVVCVGKLIGCVFGVVWGGLCFWEVVLLVIVMNVCGVMGIVVVIIGFGFGIFGL